MVLTPKPKKKPPTGCALAIAAVLVIGLARAMGWTV
jgi:hypothetical protein